MNHIASWSFQERLQYRISVWNPKFMFAMHKFIYKLTSGRIGGEMRGTPVLLLTTTGRKTGKLRTKPLMFLKDGDTYVIVASNAGLDNPPAWLFNLTANPRAEIQDRDKRIHVMAKIASSAEHSRLWPKIAAMNPFYDAYQAQTDRKIDLVILRPA